MISVVIPAYNVEKYIRQCMDSVVNQTYKNLEIIVVDDGSSDRTLDILRGYERDDRRVSVFCQENKGAGAARNLGLSKASGEYIIFLDADDFSELTMLEEAIGFLKEKGADICVFKSYEYDDASGNEHVIDYSILDWMVPDSNVFSWRDNPKRIFNFCNGWPWDKLYRREFVMRNNLQFQEIRTSNDTYFVLTSLALADRICTLRKPLLHHRVNNRDSLSTTREKSYECCFQAVDKLIPRLMELPYYDTIEQSLFNCVTNFFNWHMMTISSHYKRKLFLKMKEEMLVKYPFLKKNRADYEPPFLYDNMQNIADFDYQNYLLNERLIQNGNDIRSTINTINSRFNAVENILNENNAGVNRIVELYNESKSMNEELVHVREQLERLNVENSELRRKNDELRAELDNKNREIEYKNGEIAGRNDELVSSKKLCDDILRSRTYRVGAFLLFIPKKIVNLLFHKDYK